MVALTLPTADYFLPYIFLPKQLSDPDEEIAMIAQAEKWQVKMGAMF